MDSLKASFEDVANWCEKHLEKQQGPEIGMTFGTVLRTYGRLARLPYRLEGEHRVDVQRELNARAEKLLLNLSKRFLAAHRQSGERNMPVEPTSIRTNMRYLANELEQSLLPTVFSSEDVATTWSNDLDQRYLFLTPGATTSGNFHRTTSRCVFPSSPRYE